MYPFPMRSAALVTAALILGTPFACTPLAAQWVHYPTAGVPRKADGSLDASAATPRMADGKPDFSGVWTSDETDPRRPGVPARRGFAGAQATAARSSGKRNFRSAGDQTKATG
jgi:hypothetical protein